MKHILIALCLFVGLSAPAWARQGLLQDPAKITIGQTLDTEQVQAAITAGAAKRNWSVREAAPGRLEATLDVRAKHMARVSIDYDTQAVQIRYLDSFNLNYETVSDGRVFIHPNYNKWVGNLAADIQTQLGLAVADQAVTAPLAP
ncbi:hypothetical protein JHS3_26650 [Jeongeupia sp. HS-3]|uniref:hypothetical protein n=1 Tax=Jeongeupia sp. HS-3 TaxID=1009682 RepID=UPI0018A5CB3A|nr:hypothetical protein [Jeongeupia sp. HS-3]BCL76929.1 hypothetical protein JHS3_26650 [Jeongeupia sp. HS-3]